MEVLHQRPEPTSFVPLAEHQSRTPESFYNGPPILHHVSERCKAVTSEGELRACPALAGLRNGGRSSSGGSGNAAAEAEDDDKDVVVDEVDVWVTSEKLILFSRATTSGVSIPYPSISLHAIQRLPLPASNSSSSTHSEPVQGLYMQLAMPENTDEAGGEDVEEESVSLTIVPQQSSSSAKSTQAEAATPEEETPETQTHPQTATETLFTALSACSNLHPDAGVNDDGNAYSYNDDEDGSNQGLLNDSILAQNGLVFPGNNSSGGEGLPPPMPGSGGWITAENVHEYFDEEGNWKGAENGGDEDGDGDGQDDTEGPLGPGAGSVRTREEGSGAAAGDGADGEEDETKWRRTD